LTSLGISLPTKTKQKERKKNIDTTEI
jgi:hypothetical protein